MRNVMRMMVLVMAASCVLTACVRKPDSPVQTTVKTQDPSLGTVLTAEQKELVRHAFANKAFPLEPWASKFVEKDYRELVMDPCGPYFAGTYHGNQGKKIMFVHRFDDYSAAADIFGAEKLVVLSDNSLSVPTLRIINSELFLISISDADRERAPCLPKLAKL